MRERRCLLIHSPLIKTICAGSVIIARKNNYNRFFLQKTAESKVQSCLLMNKLLNIDANCPQIIKGFFLPSSVNAAHLYMFPGIYAGGHKQMNLL
jgi:hypothetical protein